MAVSDYHGVININRKDIPWGNVKYIHYYTNNLKLIAVINTCGGSHRGLDAGAGTMPLCLHQGHARLGTLLFVGMVSSCL